jgi:hypothetical protein
MPAMPLHIISFDNPYPPNYGGTVEVYHKIAALHKAGFTVYLHCFANKIPQQTPELNAITQKIYFYKTSNNPFHFFSKLPFSVVSRNDRQLLTNLLKVQAPILFESLKTTYIASNEKLKDYKKILRLHNIEQDYFEGIAASEKNPVKKFLYKSEARKYRNYESVIKIFDEVVTLSNYETDYINDNFKQATYIPVFHGNDVVADINGFGDYSLYHGDLRTPDNKEAIREIIGIFKTLEYPLIIASGTGEKFVQGLIEDSTNIKFVKIDSFAHLKQLLLKAHVNIIISFQRSGTKLKLINALYNSRFCIINDNIIDDPAIESLCIVANTRNEIRDAVLKLKDRPYNDASKRVIVLGEHLNDDKSANKIVTLVNKIGDGQE